jgi:ABC-2 type transport system permease protein
VTPFGQVRLLLFRSLREGARNPVLAYALPIIIPFAVLVLVAKTLYRVTDLPGFPTDNYAEWMTPAIIMLTAMTGVGYAATSLVIDVVRVLPAGTVLLVVGLVLGTDVNEGVVGVVLLYALLVLWAAAYGGLYFVVALTTRNAQAPLALAPLFLPLQFLSTQFVPKSLLPGWVQAIAAWNPFTYMIDAGRAMTTGPLTAAPVVKAVAVAVGLLVVTQALSRRAYRRAMGG